VDALLLPIASLISLQAGLPNCVPAAGAAVRTPGSVCSSKVAWGQHQTSIPSPSTVNRAVAGSTHCRMFNTFPVVKRRRIVGLLSLAPSNSVAAFTILLVIVIAPFSSLIENPCGVHRPFGLSRHVPRRATLSNSCHGKSATWGWIAANATSPAIDRPRSGLSRAAHTCHVRYGTPH